MTHKIKNIDKAAACIKKAIRNKEDIIIYGDSDLDGVASVVILEEAIKSLGGKEPEVYFPDRENDGYGINEKGVRRLKKFAPCLFVSVDLGIGNYKEVKLAQKLGFKVVIIDHHEILEKLPEAEAVVDPKQKGDKYPFKNFAAVGLVFKTIEALFKNKIPRNLRRSLIELVAMATISDMMPRKADNSMLVAEGLDSLRNTWRPGLQALFSMKEFSQMDLIQKVYKVNSLLNVREVENGLPASYRILSVSSQEKAREMAELLRLRSLKRREKINEITAEVEKITFDKYLEPIIFEGSSVWKGDYALLGISASILSGRYKKPVFLYAKGKEESYGSIRAPFDFNVVEPMKKFSKKLLSYGGHPQAAGFRIKNKYMVQFKKHLLKYFGENK